MVFQDNTSYKYVQKISGHIAVEIHYEFTIRTKLYIKSIIGSES